MFEHRFPFLLLLFAGTLCSSMIVPFMGFFLVESLGHKPWILSCYSLMAVSLTVLVNRQFAKQIDSGSRAFPLVGVAAFGYMIAVAALSLSPTLWVALSFGVAGFGVGSSATSTMFSLGGEVARKLNIERSSFNAHMRATTSTAWMIGPALTFLIAEHLGTGVVFNTALLISVLWVVLWWRVLPRSISAEVQQLTDDTGTASNMNIDLWLAAAFVFCLSLAHAITFSSLPLFYVQEVGLPGFAPGLAFSVKTFVEVIAIFSTPMIIKKFGMWPALLVTTLLAATTIQVLAMVQSMPEMLIGAALEGLYYGLYASLGISYLQSFAEDRPARATAIYWNTLMVSGLLGGPLVGFTAQIYDFQTAIRAASGIAVLAIMVLVVGRRKRGPHVRETAGRRDV
ncbi:MFS transporter, SET family, sugar efflux transporter [Aliiroseovarius halocynthiae]|uniref:MFS transporter n=1 Tax=Aliiroseovarius halocynthiae TaxID=985055 RepID=A0A545SLL5_9RHOB|nr:MFS transporter [Aliiroseovarius halocynthiae]TQV65865.1 MFS transporter [Aliiroseovarius halocynthiae]SMR83507.1 MFS transporter, SET family, sugar efflux transporter [Aliiroseovarius halocynthiae]